jgi:hypothetical protein
MLVTRTLLMPDPVISSVAAAVASQATELAVQGGKEACTALVKLIRERFGRDKAAAAALEAARGSPQDETAIAHLALELERLVLVDAHFAMRIRDLWRQAAAELSAGDGGMINSATGSVGGHLMQARDVRVEGGLHFGGAQGTGAQETGGR